MSKRYPGNFITGNPVALSQTSNNGVWDLKDNYQATSNGTWQEGDGIYEIGRSLRFRKSATAYLSRTPTTTSNQTTFTYSVWIKPGLLGSNGTNWLLTGNTGSIATNYLQMSFAVNAFSYNSDELQFTYVSGNSTVFSLTSSALHRDPSAWYHVVFVADTTNSISVDRVRMYINGSRITAFKGTTVYPSKDTTISFINSTSYEMRIGGIVTYGTFDGYMAEANFIDGQSLDASYFGYFDPITNIWQPKKYTGSYGTNGFYLLGNTTPETNFANYIGGASSGNYLTAPYSTDFALTNQDFTLEAFVYAGEAFSQNDHGIFNFGENVTSVNGKSLIFTGYASGSTSPARSLRMAASSNGSTNNLIDYVEVGNIELYTWNHVAITRTGGYIYVNINGKRTYSYNIGSTSLYNQTTYGPSIAAYRNNGTFAAVSSWPGAISNVRFTIGQCLYTGTSFTVPTAPLTTTSQGATSSNVKLLCCQSSTAAVDNSQYARTLTNVGTTSFVDHAMSLTDRSGNGNTWSFNNQLVLNLPGNRSTTNWDIMVDSPTNVFTSATDIGGVVSGNYATLNSLRNSMTLSNANLTFSATGNPASVATIGVTSGKWYWEVLPTSTSVFSGIIDSNSSTAVQLASATNGWCYYAANGYKYSQPSGNGAYGASYGNGDVIGVAFDADVGTLTFYKNNASQGTAYSGLTNGPYFPAVSSDQSGTAATGSINFGQRPFAYTPPTGFKSLNTTNLQALGTSAVGNAAIQANKWFDITLYGGSGTLRNVENSGFKPDMLWIKDRNAAQWHNITDSVRGAGVELFPNETNAEETNGGVASLNDTGFSLINWDGANKSTDSYVAWQWRQSPTAGFNIVSYTGNNGVQTISHNLGVAPSLIIARARNAVAAWVLGINYSGFTWSTDYLQLNDTGAKRTNGATTVFNSAPTSSGFSVGASLSQNGVPYIAYLWAEVPGFSKFGTYNANGSTDGPFVYTGFRPRCVIIKGTGTTQEWLILDSSRSTTVGNPVNGSMLIETPGTESTGNDIDFLSNGFKVKNSGSGVNYSPANPYIYMAWAESPFGLNNRAR